MDEKRRNLWVGLFVLFGLISLGSLVVLFGQWPGAFLRGGTYTLHVYFDEVTDIQAGNLVTVKGITVGRVVSVGLVDPGNFESGVDVEVAIDNAYRIPQGSKAITTESMLGQGRPPIVIRPGPASAAPLAAGASIDGDVQKAIDAIFPPGVVTTFEDSAAQIGEAARALPPVLDELRSLIEQRSPEAVDGSPRVIGNLSSAIARMDQSLRHFNEVLGDETVKSRLREVVDNLHGASEQIPELVDKLDGLTTDAQALLADGRDFVATSKGAVSNLDERTARVTKGLVASLDRLDAVLDNLKIATAAVAQGEGTIGRMMVDDSLYESLLFTIQRLNKSLEEVDALLVLWREEGLRVGL